MKYLLLFVCLSLQAALPPFPTANVTVVPSNTLVAITLAFDASPSPEAVGYKIYRGTNSGQYTTNFNVGIYRTNTLPGQVLGVKYYFAATAYGTNTGDESPFSNEISATAAPKTVLWFSSVTASNLAGPWGNKKLVLTITNPPSLFLTHQKEETNYITWK